MELEREVQERNKKLKIWIGIMIIVMLMVILARIILICPGVLAGLKHVANLASTPLMLSIILRMLKVLMIWLDLNIWRRKHQRRGTTLISHIFEILQELSLIILHSLDSLSLDTWITTTGASNHMCTNPNLITNPLIQNNISPK